MVATKKAPCGKASGVANFADLMAKDLPGAEVDKYMQMMGASFAEGRADIAAGVVEGAGAIDRPGKADPVCEAIANLEGRRGNATDVTVIDVNLDVCSGGGNIVEHFGLKKNCKILPMKVGDDEF